MKVSHPRDHRKDHEHGMMEVWRETQGSGSKRRVGEGDVSGEPWDRSPGCHQACIASHSGLCPGCMLTWKTKGTWFLA